MIETLIAIVVATLAAGTPLVYAAVGELVVEKSGVLNLGVEGMMLSGAIVGFITTYATGNVWLGVACGALAGLTLAALFALLTIRLKANQVASGLALAIFGTGLSALLGKPYVGVALPRQVSSFSEALAGVPLVGSFLGQLHPLVYLPGSSSQALCGSSMPPMPVSSSRPSVNRPAPPIPSAIRSSASASWRCCLGAPWPALPAPISRSSTRRFGSKG